MESAFIQWDDEDTDNRNLFSGQLPDGSYGRNTKIEYCCRTDGNATNAINLPTDSPFVLLKANTHLCQKVNGMQVRSEFFAWDNEDSNPASKKIGPVNAELDQLKNIKLHYCYYKN